ncbi:histidine kinase, partial [Paraclostridium benzoelyticum]|nr:histidine kinase [Paraclostridium benzoelyticum]
MLNSRLFWEIVITISSIIELWGCKKIFDYTSEKKVSKIKINIIMLFIIAFMLFLLHTEIYP